jgi:hypothetical protein
MARWEGELGTPRDPLLDARAVGQVPTMENAQ